MARRRPQREPDDITVVIRSAAQKAALEQEQIREQAIKTDLFNEEETEQKTKKRSGASRKTKKQQRPSAAREILSMLAYVCVVLALTFIVVQYVGQRTQVKGSSMEPTLHDGDNLIVDKISYRFRDPERFDIIVFPYLYKDETFYIKRIIGLPGETVQIIDSVIYIDGEVLSESYGAEEMVSSGAADEPVVLGADEYFVLGDNRNASADSRESTVGNIKRADIMGRAWLRIWPFDSFGILEHR